MLSTREEPSYFCLGSVFSLSLPARLWASYTSFLAIAQCPAHSRQSTSVIPFSFHRNTFSVRMEVSRKCRLEILIFYFIENLLRMYLFCI